MNLDKTKFGRVGLNVYHFDIDGGFYKGGSTVYFQSYDSDDKVTHAGKLKSDCVLIKGKLNMEPTKVKSFDHAIEVAETMPSDELRLSTGLEF